MDDDNLELNSSDLRDLLDDDDDQDTKPPLNATNTSHKFANLNKSPNKPIINDDTPKLDQAPKRLSVIDFSHLMPTTSSITISDATNESLNTSYKPLIPNRVSQQTPKEEVLPEPQESNESKPKFDLPPLFSDIDDEDSDSQPNLNPANFPSDHETPPNPLFPKDKGDSITLNSTTINNSIAPNTSLFKGPSNLLPHSILHVDTDSTQVSSETDKSQVDDNITPNFAPQLTTTKTNDSITFGHNDSDNFEALPLVPLRKRESQEFLDQSKPSLSRLSKSNFLNITELKNLSHSTSFPIPNQSEENKNDEHNNDDDRMSIKITDSDDDFAEKPASKSPSKPSTIVVTSQSNSNEIQRIEIEDNYDDDNQNVFALNSDDEDISSVEMSIHSSNGIPPESKVEFIPDSSKSQSTILQQTKNQSAILQQNITPNSNQSTDVNITNSNFITDQSSDKKASQIQMSNVSQSVIPSHSKNTPSSLNETGINRDRQSFFQTIPDNQDNETSGSQKDLYANAFTSENAVNQKEMNITPVNESYNSRSNEKKPKTKTDIVESVHKMRNSIQQSTKKKPNRIFDDNYAEATQKTENSPPLKTTGKSPSNSPTPIESPRESSSGSFHDQTPPAHNQNKSQTIISLPKNDEQLSSVSLHLSSEQAQQKPRVAKMAIEVGVEHAFDRASSNFQRLFFNEFQAIMRPTYQIPFHNDLDNFFDILTNDINKELDNLAKSFPPSARKIQSIPKRIEEMFQQGSKLIQDRLSFSQEDKMKQRSEEYDKLINLSNSINTLNNSFLSKTMKTRRIIENYIHDSQCYRANRFARQQIVQKELRKMTLRIMNLEAKVKSQISEFEDLDRKQNDIIMERLTFDVDESMYIDYDESEMANIRKMAHEIALLNCDIERESLDDVTEMINDTLIQLNRERMMLRDEYGKFNGLSERIKRSMKMSKKPDLRRKKSRKNKE